MTLKAAHLVDSQYPIDIRLAFKARFCLFCFLIQKLWLWPFLGVGKGECGIHLVDPLFYLPSAQYLQAYYFHVVYSLNILHSCKLKVHPSTPFFLFSYIYVMSSYVFVHE